MKYDVDIPFDTFPPINIPFGNGMLHPTCIPFKSHFSVVIFSNGKYFKLFWSKSWWNHCYLRDFFLCIYENEVCVWGGIHQKKMLSKVNGKWDVCHQHDGNIPFRKWDVGVMGYIPVGNWIYRVRSAYVETTFAFSALSLLGTLWFLPTVVEEEES